MKNVIIYLAFCASACMGCSRAVFTPEYAENPWPDDYSEIYAPENYGKWGPYNVHDPAVVKVGDFYYMYSTDAIYRDNPRRAAQLQLPRGFIQMRRSRNLVDWEFVGWALDSLPPDAVEFVRSRNKGHGATNVWAPYPVIAPDDSMRLYFCLSAFGKNTSCICLASAPSPEGPWKYQGMVVSTDASSTMNAIDPTVVTALDGRQWMHYGSYFGGLHCLELDPITGMPVAEGEKGHLVARRANYRKDNLEAPEIIYVPEQQMYYLFVSYEPLMTTYNVRVGRSRNADGPFYDYHGKLLSDTTNNFPLLTAPYSFQEHPGWVGTAHCGVFSDGAGNYFMAHQGRFALDPGMMVLHLRQMFFTPDGWPVVSPERFAATPPCSFSEADIAGDWEILRLHEPTSERNLEAGQILWGEGDLINGEWNNSVSISLRQNGKIGGNSGTWNYKSDEELLTLVLNNEKLENLRIFAGHDWERSCNTILFTGLDSDGRGVWGKRVR